MTPRPRGSHSVRSSRPVDTVYGVLAMTPTPSPGTRNTPHLRHRWSRAVVNRYGRLALALLALAWPAGCGDRSDHSTAKPAPNAAATNDARADEVSTKDSSTDAAEDGWRAIFNARSLAGWSTSVGDLGAWGVVSGELVTLHPGKGDWLFTKDRFTDFELKLEFFLPEHANSGVGLRVADIGDPGYGGYEIQLVDSAGQRPTMRNAGAVFDIAPASVMAINPANEWNSLRVRLVGQTLDAWLNGVHIHDARRLAPLPDRDPFAFGEETTGRISLQDNGGSVRFRNIRIRSLNHNQRGVFSPDSLTGRREKPLTKNSSE